MQTSHTIRWYSQKIHHTINRTSQISLKRVCSSGDFCITSDNTIVWNEMLQLRLSVRKNGYNRMHKHTSSRIILQTLGHDQCCKLTQTRQLSSYLLCSPHRFLKWTIFSCAGQTVAAPGPFHSMHGRARFNLSPNSFSDHDHTFTTWNG